MSSKIKKKLCTSILSDKIQRTLWMPWKKSKREQLKSKELLFVHIYISEKQVFKESYSFQEHQAYLQMWNITDYSTSDYSDWDKGRHPAECTLLAGWVSVEVVLWRAAQYIVGCGPHTYWVLGNSQPTVQNTFSHCRHVEVLTLCRWFHLENLPKTRKYQFYKKRPIKRGP